MPTPLSDCIALVTGASRGIGAALALQLAEAGAHVVAVARTVGGLEELDDKISAVGGSATLVPLDLKDMDGIARLALLIVFGRPAPEVELPGRILVVAQFDTPIEPGAERVRMVELSAEEAGPVLRAFPEEVPTGVGFMKRAGLVAEGRPEEFEALAGRCAVFRFDPA